MLPVARAVVLTAAVLVALVLIDPPTTTMRTVNLVLSTVLAFCLTAATWARVDRLTRREQRSMPWLIAIFGCSAYGSWEAAFATTEARVPLVTVALLGLIVSVIRNALDPHADERP